MLIDNYFTQQYIPEDNSEHHTRRHENLKSHEVYLVYEQKELHNVLVTHLLAHADQRHSVHKNEYEKCVYNFRKIHSYKYHFEVVKCNFCESLHRLYNVLVTSIGNNMS
jgi:hypothetical protein